MTAKPRKAHRGGRLRFGRRPQRMSDAIVQHIKDLIYQGRVEPGQKLPSERELAEDFNVGRPTVREAIQQLEGIGLIEVRPAVGIFVRSFKPDSLQAPLRRMLQDELNIILQFVDIRMALEGWGAAEAARRARPEQVQRIHALAEDLEGRAERGESLLQLDLAFHQAVLEASNEVMHEISEALASMISSVQAFMNLMTWRDQGPARVAHHRGIARAIEAADAEGARNAMVAHLRVLRATLVNVDLRPAEVSPAR